MLSRLIATALGFVAMAVAPAAAAAFPEDFVAQASSSSALSVSSSSSIPSSSSVSSESSISSDSSTSSVSSESSESSASSASSSQTIILAPQQQLTRAEFTALIVEKLYSQAELDRCFWEITSPVPPRFTLVFTDVHVNDRFAKHICVAMHSGLVSGYGDGSFRPDRHITFAESAKIIARAFALAPYAQANRLEPWYREYVEVLGERNAIPLSIDGMEHTITGAEAADMFLRLSQGVTWLPSRSYEELAPKPRKPAASLRSKPVATDTPAGGASSSVSSAENPTDGSAGERGSSRPAFRNPFGKSAYPDAGMTGESVE